MTAPLVLWYTPVANIAGVGRHILDVAREGIPGFHLVFALPEGPLAEKLRAQGAAVVTGHYGVEAGAARAVRDLRYLLRTLSPRIIHTHLAFADLVAVAAVTGMKVADGTRIKVVSTEHGIAGDSRLYQANWMSAGVKKRLHALRLHRTDHVIAVSDSTREQILRQWGSGAPISVIRNGIDRCPSEVRKREPGMRFLSLARLSHEKQIDKALQAFALVAKDHPDARFTIAGEGPERAQLENLVARQGLENRVTFPGFLDAREAFAGHDVVVQLSAWENLSYTLLDAVNRGLGVVATPVGGNGEIVGAHGLVQADDTRAVAAAMVIQARDVGQRVELPYDIPGVAEMNRQISEVYNGVYK